MLILAASNRKEYHSRHKHEAKWPWNALKTQQHYVNCNCHLIFMIFVFSNFSKKRKKKKERHLSVVAITLAINFMSFSSSFFCLEFLSVFVFLFYNIYDSRVGFFLHCKRFMILASFGIRKNWKNYSVQFLMQFSFCFLADP